MMNTFWKWMKIYKSHKFVKAINSLGELSKLNGKFIYKKEGGHLIQKHNV